MEKLLVVVFDSEAKAIEGLQVLRDLDSEGEISFYDRQLVAKEPGGAVRVIDSTQVARFPIVAGGTAVGGLIGLLGGPLGVVVGAAAGAMVGITGSVVQEAREAGVTDEFVHDVTAAMTPGKFAVVAEIVEDWVTPLDMRMEAIGGLVFRRTRTFVETTEEDRDASAHRAEMEQLKVERTQAKSDRLAKIDARIDSLRVKLENAIERKRVKMQLRQQQREAKIQALQAKANQTKGENRRRQEARIADLRREYEDKAAVS